MHNEKKYLTIEEQINLLLEKGLQIKSTKIATKYLADIGYYKLINGYRTPFIIFEKLESGETVKKFQPNTSIDDLYHLYKFDQDLKSLIFKNISYIEITIKARIADFISQKYGIKESEYLLPNNFKPDSPSPKSKEKKFIELHSDILKNITEQDGKHDSITWYSKTYGYFPFWVVSNILTFGTISLLYSKMKQNDQYEISHQFGIKSDLFENMLMILLLFRNKCAHNEVLYNFKTKWALIQRDIKNIFEIYKIPTNPKNGKRLYGVNDIFALIIIFKFLLDKSHFNEFIAQLKSLLSTLRKKLGNQTYQKILTSMGIIDDLELIKKL